MNTSLFVLILLYTEFPAMVWSGLPIVQIKHESKDHILAVGFNTIEDFQKPVITVDYAGLEEIELSGPIHIVLPSLTVPLFVWDTLASMMLRRISIVTQSKNYVDKIPQRLADKVEIVLLTPVESKNSRSWLIYRQCPSQSMFTPWIYISSDGKSSPISTACPFPLQGRKVPTSVLGRRPFIVKVPGKILGMDVDLLDIMAEKLKFTPALKAMKSRTAQVAMVGNGSVTLTIGHLSISYSYGKDMDFSHAYYPLEMKLLTKKPEALKPFWNVVKPFSSGLWGSIIGAFLLSIITVLILTGQRMNVFNVYASLLGQSCWHTHHYSSTAMVIYLLAWLGFIFFIDASYECNLRAYLMSVDFESPVDSAKDLVEQNRYTFFPGGTHNWHLLKTSLEEEKRIVATRSKEKNMFLNFFVKGKLSPEHLRKHIYEEGHATMLYGSMAQAEFPDLEHHFGYQPFHVSKHSIVEGLQVLGIKKKVIWIEEFNTNFLRLVDAGFPIYLFRKYIKAKYLLPEPPSTRPPEPFVMAHILAPMLILIAGGLISSLVFMQEKIAQNMYGIKIK